MNVETVNKETTLAEQDRQLFELEVQEKMITKQHIITWIETCASVLSEKTAYLNELDSPIGDADHGTNMSRGFAKAKEKLDSIASMDIGNILKTIGMTLIASVGGASGPLYGTFFMRAGTVVSAKHELDRDDLVAMLEAGLRGLQERGRAEVGEKTMVDVVHPAVEAVRAAVEADDDLETSLTAAIKAAEQGVYDTIPLVAKKGRASYLGELSAGHQDPGATSTYFILSILLNVVKGSD